MGKLRIIRKPGPEPNESPQPRQRRGIRAWWEDLTRPDSDHLLVIGYNQTLPEVHRRLGLHLAADSLNVVVLLPPSRARDREEIDRSLRHGSGRTKVLVADLEGDGLARAGAGDAKRIIVLSPPGEDADEADLEVMAHASLLERHLAPLGDQAPPVGVEFRRQRNVNAFWYSTAPGTGSPDQEPSGRFPSNFEAIADDRIIGGRLSLAIMNPAFAKMLIGSEARESVAPDLRPAGALAGMTFAQARAEMEPVTLLGLIRGEGHAAQAEYVVDDRREIEADERLIVLEHSGDPSGLPASEPDPVRFKVAPARTGALLLVGWSDTTRALLEDLAGLGFDGGDIHVLNPERPVRLPDSLSGGKPNFLSGDPTEPADISYAIERSGPGIIFVAAGAGREAKAVISGLLVNQRTDVPIVVERDSIGPAARIELAVENLIVISVAGLVAEKLALACVDPAILAATEAMLAADMAIETLVYSSREPLGVESLGSAFANSDSTPLAVVVDDADSGQLHPGDQILVLHRAGSGSLP